MSRVQVAKQPVSVTIASLLATVWLISCARGMFANTVPILLATRKSITQPPFHLKIWQWTLSSEPFWRAYVKDYSGCLTKINHKKAIKEKRDVNGRPAAVDILPCQTGLRNLAGVVNAYITQMPGLILVTRDLFTLRRVTDDETIIGAACWASQMPSGVSPNLSSKA